MKMVKRLTNKDYRMTIWADPSTKIDDGLYRVIIMKDTEVAIIVTIQSNGVLKMDTRKEVPASIKNQLKAEINNIYKKLWSIVDRDDYVWETYKRLFAVYKETGEIPEFNGRKITHVYDPSLKYIDEEGGEEDGNDDVVTDKIISRVTRDSYF